jgi:hypothetical protein
MNKLYTIIISLILAFSCSEDLTDPCANIVCLNGGGCNNGKCACPPGYLGDDCGLTMEPKKVRLTKIQVTKFPSTNTNGEAWDSNNGPDLYVNLGLIDGFSYLTTESNKIDNALSGQVYEWDIEIIYELEPVTSDFFVDLRDHDDTGIHPLIGRGLFKPYDPARGLPASITVESTSGLVTFRLYVSYSF